MAVCALMKAINSQMACQKKPFCRQSVACHPEGIPHAAWNSAFSAHLMESQKHLTLRYSQKECAAFAILIC